MPRIPTTQSEIAARTGRPSNFLPQTRADGDDFGAQIGRAQGALAEGIDRLGSGVASIGAALDQMDDRKRNENVSNLVAQSDFTQREMAIRNETPADGKGYYDRTREEYTKYVEEQANKLTDDRARTEYRSRMLQQMPAISSRSATYQATLQATDSKAQADASLAALQNKIMTDPTMYDEYVKQGIDVVNSRPGVNATMKAGMETEWKQNAARMRFEGMLETAKSPAELDAIAKELTGAGASSQGPDERPKQWANEFRPEDYRKMVNDIGIARNAMRVKADADARAALDTIQDRANDTNALLPQDELTAVQQLVKNSENPITVSRMARIMRNEEIKKSARTQRPEELRAEINAASGNPGVVYPGLPPRLSGAVNNASQRFGVSASYLGNMAQREYGQFLTRGPAQGKPQFMPQTSHGGVDLRNVRPDVVDAAAVAGELFGRPLQINSGYRSQERQNAIRAAGDPNRASVAKESHHTSSDALDISTAGMSAADQGRLVGSLVDAGFTGIGQYGGHIHADFRKAVPGSFSVAADGSGYGGWTKLSPEVTAELTKRGFAAGKTADQIARARPVQSVDAVDYGRGTSVMNADGKPASSALGVAQFTTGTFIEVMRDQGIAARIGLNTSVMSDEQLLELRKDPDVSMMAAAALAQKNGQALGAALGRGASDPELYMAHVLGAGGAISLIRAMQQNPNQSAAALMPDAARNNKPYFYEGGKELTAEQAYNRIALKFQNSTSQVSFGDNEMRQKLLSNMETALKNDPMTHAATTGTFAVTPLDASQGFAMRAAEARGVADYYNIPAESMKPFTEDEAQSLSKRMKDGTVDDVLEAMTAIQQMGPEMAKAAILQLGEKEPVYAFAAGLQASNGGYAASDIVRGQKRIEENPAIKQGMEGVNEAFNKATGGSLYEIAPDQRQAIQNAAFAHYIETAVARGRAEGFDPKLFETSVQAVLGGVQGKPAMEEVNGAMTILPPGITASDLEQAFPRMTVDDWARMSVDKLPPRYVDGNIIAPDDLADEAKLRAIGGGQYKIMLDDGTFAVTGELAQNGRMSAYIFTPNAKDVKDVANRPVAQQSVPDAPPSRDAMTNGDGTLTINEDQRLREAYGPLYRFDENGRWLGPAEGAQQ